MVGGGEGVGVDDQLSLRARSMDDLRRVVGTLRGDCEGRCADEHPDDVPEDEECRCRRNRAIGTQGLRALFLKVNELV
jgi:hypothetical protein